MIVAFEGPDLTGKTSVLQAVQDLGRPFSLWPRIHMKVTREMLLNRDELDRSSAAFYDGLAHVSRAMPFFMDRCYMTDYIYGKAYGHQVGDWVTRAAETLHPLIFYLYTPIAVLLDRLKWRGDWFVDEVHIKKIYNEYEKWRLYDVFKRRHEVVTVETKEFATVGEIAASVGREIIERMKA